MANTRALEWDDDVEPPSPEIEKGKRHLLAIGIDKYHECAQLHNAVKDAVDITEVLESQYGFEASDVKLLTNEEATEERIFDEFRKLVQKVQPEDYVVIFFSGHGHYDHDFKQGYWIPVDAKEGNIGDYIPNSEISNTIRAIPSLHTFMIADACFSGSLFGESRSVTAKRDSSSYHHRVAAIPSRWGLASGRNEVVADGEPGKNSPFSESLIYFLKNQDETSFSVSELVQYVKTVTSNNADQTPIGSPLRHVGDKGGEFVFVPNTVREKQPQQARTQADSQANRQSEAHASANLDHRRERNWPLAWLQENSRTLSLVVLSSIFFGLWDAKMLVYVPLTLLGIMGGCALYDLHGSIKRNFTFAALTTASMGYSIYYWDKLATSVGDGDKWFNNHKVLVFFLGALCLIGFLHFFLGKNESKNS